MDAHALDSGAAKALGTALDGMDKIATEDGVTVSGYVWLPAVDPSAGDVTPCYRVCWSDEASAHIAVPADPGPAVNACHVDETVGGET